MRRSGAARSWSLAAAARSPPRWSARCSRPSSPPTTRPAAISRARLPPPAWTEAGSAAHLLGTDQLGRDILSRIIFGARVSLLVGVVSSLIGGTIGLALGMLGGYFRGRTDSVVAKLIDMQLAFPFLLFAITVIAVLGPSLPISW